MRALTAMALIALATLPASAQAGDPVEANGLVILLTDYGTDSIYVGMIKGAIYSAYLDAKVDSLTNSVPPFDITLLSQKGSLFATRPSLMTYTEARKDLVAAATDLFEMVDKGKIRIAVNQTYRLENAAAAHADLEARRTTGSTVLLP